MSDHHIGRTERNFEFAEFPDHYNEPCSIQQSSAIGDAEDAFERPGSSFLWLGRDCPDKDDCKARMHLSPKQVEALIVMMQRWLDTGCLHDPAYLAQVEKDKAHDG